MKSKLTRLAFAFTLSLSPVHQAFAASELVGQILGGVLGGALCNGLGIGKGNGRVAAVAICAIGGSVIGGGIAKEMNEQDARAYNDAQDASFDGELDQDYRWDGGRYGSRTGINGRLRPISEGYHRSSREKCREYISTSVRGNREYENRSVVCRKRDGSYYTLDEKSFYVNGRLVERQTTERVERGGRVPPPVQVRPVPPRHEERPNRRCSGWNSNDLRRGDTVYNRAGQRGQITGFTRDYSRARVDFGRFSFDYSVRELGIEGCHLGLSTGITVDTSFNQSGILSAIFSNGDVAVDTGRPTALVLSSRSIFY